MPPGPNRQAAPHGQPPHPLAVAVEKGEPTASGGPIHLVNKLYILLQVGSPQADFRLRWRIKVCPNTSSSAARSG